MKINKTNDEWFYESELLKYGVIIFIGDLKLFKLLAFLYFHVEINWLTMAALSTIVFTALPLLCFFGAKRAKKSMIFSAYFFAHFLQKVKKQKKTNLP